MANLEYFERSINWVEHTSQAIRTRCSEVSDHAEELTEALTALLLTQLPKDACLEMMRLLPSDMANSERLRDVRDCADCDPQGEIHFSDFIQKSREILTPERLDRHSHAAAITYLWAVVQDLPPDLKGRMQDLLPSDLRSRMDLYSGHTDEAKVA